MGRCIRDFGGETCARGHLEDLGVKGIILNKIFKKQNGGMECTDLALGKNTWCALMKEVMNLRVPYVVTIRATTSF